MVGNTAFFMVFDIAFFQCNVKAAYKVTAVGRAK